MTLIGLYDPNFIPEVSNFDKSKSYAISFLCINPFSLRFLERLYVAQQIVGDEKVTYLSAFRASAALFSKRVAGIVAKNPDHKKFGIPIISHKKGN